MGWGGLGADPYARSGPIPYGGGGGDMDYGAPSHIVLLVGREGPFLAEAAPRRGTLGEGWLSNSASPRPAQQFSYDCRLKSRYASCFRYDVMHDFAFVFYKLWQ